MKKLLLSVSMLCSIAFAQDFEPINMVDCNLKTDIVDEFTGEVKKVTTKERVGASEVGFLKASIGRIKDTRALYLTFSGDLGCLSYSSYVIIKFTDGTTVKIKNLADTDCGDYPTFIAILEDTETLGTKTIEKIRLSYSEYYSDITIKDKSFIINGLNCVE